MALKYLGADPRTDWIPGVPSRDLSDEEIKEFGLDETALAASRLYEKQAAQAAPKGDN
jgi:hypothetical protein